MLIHQDLNKQFVNIQKSTKKEITNFNTIKEMIMGCLDITKSNNKQLNSTELNSKELFPNYLNIKELRVK